jgi:hypothetical protein
LPVRTFFATILVLLVALFAAFPAGLAALGDAVEVATVDHERTGPADAPMPAAPPFDCEDDGDDGIEDDGDDPAADEVLAASGLAMLRVRGRFAPRTGHSQTGPTSPILDRPTPPPRG